MTILRTNIEKALEEIISNEEGMRFQGLAVVLAKKKWPELIASERKKDLGLDAYVSAQLSGDGIGKALSCSITATLKKIQDDIAGETGFSKHVNDVSILLFATPCKVTNQKAESWKESISKKYNIKLQVLSREDIITDLLLPSNASICQSHLNIHIDIEPPIRELIEKAHAASAEVVNTWLEHPRLVNKPIIELQSVKLDENGKDTQEILGLEHLQQAILQSRRIVLEAPAGGGKTTTLIQLAKRDSVRGELSFLVDMPVWLESNTDILEFIAKSPQFLSRGLDAKSLAQIYNTIPCIFLLNGWNEISDSYSEKAVNVLTDLARNFSKAGIIVATRTHHILPTLPGSFRLRIRPLNKYQRIEYLNSVLGTRARELILQLENDPVLDDLTRTPLILAQVTNIFLSERPIPKTKAGVLDAVIKLIEESDEHRDHLARSPLNGNARYYLADLAIQMSVKGSVIIEKADAYNVINSVNRVFQTEGQIVSLPEPSEILNILSAHHILERVEHPSVAFRFQHQQFQEWYVSKILTKYLLRLIEKNDNTDNKEFIRKYINEPSWEEPLRMIVEDIGSLNPESPGTTELFKAGIRLVELTVEVDPIFAADLARLCGGGVWKEVRDIISKRLRSLYQTGNNCFQLYAVAGMLASGSEDFKDITIPLLASDNSQDRLRTYRLLGEFHISSIGEDWKQNIKKWKEDCRADFISEVVRRRNMSNIAEEFAREDQSPRVRGAALRTLEWMGARDSISRVLLGYTNETLEKVLQEQILNRIPLEAIPRVVEIYDLLLQRITDPKDRLRIRVAKVEIGSNPDIDGMKEELIKWPAGLIKDNDGSLIKSAMEIIKDFDREWVSQWIANGILNGFLLWGTRWADLISILPDNFRQGLSERICNEVLQYKDNVAIKTVLLAIADVKLASYIVSQLSIFQGAVSKAAIIRQIEELLRDLPPSLAVAGLVANISSNFNQSTYQVAIKFLNDIGSKNSEKKIELPDDLRQHIRNYIKSGVHFVLSEDDYSGNLKSQCAQALSRIGDPQDINELSQIIQADIERKRKGIEALRKGHRGHRSNGASVSYSNWNVQAVENLDSQQGEEILLRLLNEPEYEKDAISGLLRMARIRERKIDFGKQNYRVILEIRSERHDCEYDEARRSRCINAIKRKIAEIKEQNLKSDVPGVFNGRLKMLARFLAIADAHQSAKLVMEIMNLPQKWDSYIRVEAIEILLFNGVELDADNALIVLNPAISYLIQSSQLNDQQNRYLLQRCLCLLSFLSPSLIGVNRIREIMASVHFQIYELREIIKALGYSRCDEAFDLLMEIHEKYNGSVHHFIGDWVEAMANLSTSKSKQALINFIDPSQEPFKGRLNLEHYDKEKYCSYIADIARNDSSVKERLYALCTQSGSPANRALLSGILSSIGTEEALCGGLNLIHDQIKPMIPHELWQGLENAFLGRKPYGSTGHTYVIEPISANGIRNLLFKMSLEDNDRKQSALLLLRQIELWRLEYGRPNNEPRSPAFDFGEPSELIIPKVANV